MNHNKKYKDGLQVLKQLNEKAIPNITSLGDLGRYVIEFGFGEIFKRERLTIREREIATIAILTVLGREPQLKLHFKAALNNGFNLNEIEEIIIQTIPYAGFPTAMNAMNLMNQLTEDKE